VIKSPRASHDSASRALKDRFGQREIAVRHRGLDVGDNTGHGRNGEQTRGNQLSQHLH
jgi:hypothetical protein